MALAEHEKEELAVGLFDTGLLQFQYHGWTLSSGRQTSIDYRQPPLASFRRGLEVAGRPVSIAQQRRVRELAIQAYASAIDELPDDHDHLYGLPQAGIAFGAMVALRRGDSYLWGRDGQYSDDRLLSKKRVEGKFGPYDTAKVIDDVLTTAGPKILESDRVETDELLTAGFVVMLDYQEGGIEAMRGAGHNIEVILGLSEATRALLAAKRIGNAELDWIQEYHQDVAARPGGISTFSLE